MDIKPGYKTTEFWLQLAAEVTAVLLASDVIKSPEALKIVALCGALVGRIMYVISRNSQKSA